MPAPKGEALALRITLILDGWPVLLISLVSGTFLAFFC
jgi:hypothetical protein